MNAAHQPSERDPIPNLRLYAASLGLWFLFALVIAGYSESAGAPVIARMGFWSFLAHLYVVLLPFAMISPFSFKLGVILYGRSRARWVWCLQHLGLCALWYVTAKLLSAPFELAFWRPVQDGAWDVLVRPGLSQFLSAVGSYWIVALAATFSAAFHDRQAREAALEGLRAQLSESKLANLRDKLNPHFLFNAVNAAVAFIRVGRNREAEEMLLALAELMDALLSPETPLEVRLEQEVALLKKYLKVEQIRFGNKLRIVLEIAPESKDAMVPAMLLQPLVENAVRHGIARLRGSGVVKLRTGVEDGCLWIRIYNDIQPGASFSKGKESGHGLGLSLTRARLRQAHGAAAALEASPFGESGFLVKLALPHGGSERAQA